MRKPVIPRAAISSLQNDRIKAIRALEMRKTRKASGLFVAEGLSLLMTAREHGHVPETLVAGPGAADTDAARAFTDWAQSAGAEVLDVSAAVLEKLAAKDNPQTVLGVFRQRLADAPDPAAVPATATWLMLQAIRDPGNLGTILRTVDAVGAAGVILAGTCCDPFARECVRATMGSIFAVPLVHLADAAVPDFLARWPGDSIATHLSAAEDFRTATYRGPALLVMGSEGPGLTEAVARACSKRVKIPMAGRLDSLNLAVATALTLYHLRGAQLKL
jgi:RNA methyltransferase, TrmH family